MDAKKIPVVVRMRVECSKCGHREDETYEFDMPIAEAQPMEADERQIRPRRSQQMQ